MSTKIVLILLPFLLLSACASRSSQPSNELTVEMTDFAYTPSSLTIPAGQPITLTLNNTGNIEHDFVVEKISATTKLIQDNGSTAHHAHGAEQSFDVHVSARAGETSIVELTVSEPGTYKIFCSVEGHEEAGMSGELTVTDPE